MTAAAERGTIFKLLTSGCGLHKQQQRFAQQLSRLNIVLRALTCKPEYLCVEVTQSAVLCPA